MSDNQLIILEDSCIEILYNSMLSNNPYLIRIYNYDSGYYEFRTNEQDLKTLIDLIDSLLLSQSKTYEVMSDE